MKYATTPKNKTAPTTRAIIIPVTADDEDEDESPEQVELSPPHTPHASTTLPLYGKLSQPIQEFQLVLLRGRHLLQWSIAPLPPQTPPDTNKNTAHHTTQTVRRESNYCAQSVSGKY